MDWADSLKTLKIRGKRLLPVVQGGMGVGISAHRLAGAVAKEGAVGTISSVDLRHHHPDLVAQTARSRDKELIDRVNLVALDREVRAARETSEGRGLIAVNVMRAVSAYASYVRQSCESGAGAVVMGAGLPLDLPDLAADFPDVALIPILSDARGIALVVKRWMRKQRLPDAIVIEHPRYAGGHLGAAKVEDVNDSRFDFARVVPEALAALRELGLESLRIPLVVAGGINGPQKVKAAFALGAAAVQVGTAFAVTEEGDAHPTFKKVLAEARREDIVVFQSVAGLPARAVRTAFLDRYLKQEQKLRDSCGRAVRRCAMGFDCLIQCGLRDSLAKMGQFCIDLHLSAALKGDVRRGLFFRGSEPVPFGATIRPVADLIRYLLTGEAPEGVQVEAGCA